jgi:hypothetical protein
MCRYRWSLLVAMFVALPGLLHGQSGAERARLRGLLARADSLWALRAAQDSAAAQLVRAGRRARLWTDGDVAVALWGGVSSGAGDSLVAVAASQLREFGLVPVRFMRGIVMIEVNAADTAALRAAPAMRGRQPVLLDWVPGDFAGAAKVAYEITRAYGLSLDSAARVWLPSSAGESWELNREGARATRWLVEERTTSGTRCLAGEAGGCRRWLGLDDAAQPLSARYSTADIRRLLATYRYSNARLQACMGGDDGSCYKLVEENLTVGINPIPAPDDARNSLLHYVRATRGAEALQRVFEDRQGLMGARFARATGQSVDSLVLGWRAWVLSRGRPERVRTPVGEAVTALLSAGLLTFLATRRQRWQ